MISGVIESKSPANVLCIRLVSESFKTVEMRASSRLQARAEWSKPKSLAARGFDIVGFRLNETEQVQWFLAHQGKPVLS